MGQRSVRRYTFATIGSVYKNPALFAHFGLVLLDEAHGHNIKNTTGMYSSFFKEINKIRAKEKLPEIKVIGLTATPYRNVQGYHTDENGDLSASVTLKLINRMKPEFWKRILVNVGIGDLIRDGYLSKVEYENRSFMLHEDMKLNKWKSDFDLDNFAVKLGTRQQQVVECILDAQTRFKSILVFCPSVSQAEKYAKVIPMSAAVSAKTKDYDRARIGAMFKAGQIHTIFNMGVYTTGFDYPELECVILLRPTRSLALYMQMLGRVVRIAPGKRCGTVIDWTNTVEKLGRIETVELRRQQFPEWKYPMWEIFSEGDRRWHNTPLYSYAIKKKGYKDSVQSKYQVQKRFW